MRDVPREHLLEALRAHLTAKPKRRRPAPVPGARAAVLGVVLRVEPVFLEVLHLGLGGADRGDAREPSCGTQVTGGGAAPKSTVRAYASTAAHSMGLRRGRLTDPGADR